MAAVAAQADNWPEWRGPKGNGFARKKSSDNLVHRIEMCVGKQNCLRLEIPPGDLGQRVS